MAKTISSRSVELALVKICFHPVGLAENKKFVFSQMEEDENKNLMFLQLISKNGCNFIRGSRLSLVPANTLNYNICTSISGE